MCNEKKRIIIKRGSGVPTIPASTDHTDGTWIATDIYEGEQYLDTDTGITYTRNGSSIFTTGSCGELILKFRIYQRGTSAPTIIEYCNPYGYTITTVRDGAGVYRVLGLSGETLATDSSKYEIQFSTNSLLAGSSLDVYPSNDTDLVVLSYNNTGTLDDNVILRYPMGTGAVWNVITVTKYP